MFRVGMRGRSDVRFTIIFRRLKTIHYFFPDYLYERILDPDSYVDPNEIYNF